MDNKHLQDIVNATLAEHGVGTVPEILAAIAAGADPRYDTSPVYDLAIEIIKKDLKLPEDVRTLLSMITSSSDLYDKARVDIRESHMAARTLMEYAYPKLKNMETTATVDKRLVVGQLTAEDIAEVDAMLDDEPF